MENIEDVLKEWGVTAAGKSLKNREFDINKTIDESKNRVVSITGIRRAGKSSVLMLIYRKLATLEKKAAYANLEDNRLQIPEALDEILKQTPNADWLLLDEVTSAKEWENWIHRINEMKSVHLITTSSLNKLSRFPPKALRGRISYFELFPLSFVEFLEFKNIKTPKTTREIGVVERELNNYLTYGGFPEVVLSENKVNIIQEYINSIVALDVATLSTVPMKVVSDFSAQLIGTTLFSATKLENVMKNMGHKIGKSTLLELEQLFETAYLAFFVPVFSTKIKDETLYPRKVYLGDTGFFYAARGKKNFGRVYENAVFLQLRRKLNPLGQISYYRSAGNQEVDFVIRQGSEVKKLIQVVYELDDEKTKEREIKALIEAADEFGLDGKRDELQIITKDYEAKEDISGKKIIYKKLWKWLIEEGSRILVKRN
ncbi:MAG: ATP-binding protein [Candidatus Micrarchaeia archaeon]